MDFAPTAHVTLAEFNEEDRPVMIAVPIQDRNFLLARINPDKSSGPDKRVQSVVVHPDISVERTRPIYLLKHQRHQGSRQHGCTARTSYAVSSCVRAGPRLTLLIQLQRQRDRQRASRQNIVAALRLRIKNLEEKNRELTGLLELVYGELAMAREQNASVGSAP